MQIINTTNSPISLCPALPLEQIKKLDEAFLSDSTPRIDSEGNHTPGPGVLVHLGCDADKNVVGAVKPRVEVSEDFLRSIMQDKTCRALFERGDLRHDNPIAI